MLGMSKPIVQAPMAGVSTPSLAAQVSEAGGLGSLGIGAMKPEAAREAIRATRALTGKAFNVNVFCHQPAVRDARVEDAWLRWLAPRFTDLGASVPERLNEIYTSFVADPQMLDVLLDEKPAVVSFHFGLPGREAIRRLKMAGIVLMASVTKLEEASMAAASGIDVLVAQGIEAGGHRGVFDPDAVDEGLGILPLTRMLVRRLDLPVIAAGGIMDGAGIAAVLMLGAEAAQLGTAFVACPESSIDRGYRSALMNSSSARTVLTRAISGRPARSMANQFTALGESPQAPAVPDYPLAYDAGKALHEAAKAHGQFGYGAQWAGQAARLARAMPAAELVRVLERERVEAMQRTSLRA
jgi:nitronate monooxygenase